MTATCRFNSRLCVQAVKDYRRRIAGRTASCIGWGETWGRYPGFARR